MPRETTIDEKRWSKFFPLSRQDVFVRHIDEAIDGVPGTYCMVLSSLDGMQLARAVRGREINTSRLAAIVGSLCGLGETLGKELGQNQFRNVIISTETGIAVMQRVPHPGDRTVLMAGATHEANVGMLSAQLRFCADNISELAFVPT